MTDNKNYLSKHDIEIIEYMARVIKKHFDKLNENQPKDKKYIDDVASIIKVALINYLCDVSNL